MSTSGTFINQTYDDRDTTDLHYAGGWESPQVGSWNASNVGQSGTLSSTEDIRANVTFIFPTPANAVYYYGIPRCCGGLYAICVDCDPDNPIFEMIDAVNVTDDGKNPPVILWSKSFNGLGIHQILLTNQNDPRFGHSQITIDRFELQIPNTAQVVTSLISETTAASSATSSATSSSAPVIATTSSVPVGAIIGAIAGPLSLIGFIIFIWVFRRRRKRRSRAVNESQSQGAQMGVTPFFVPSVALSSIQSSNPESGSSNPSKRSNRHKRSPHSASDMSTSVASTSLSPVDNHPATGRLIPQRREIDAGHIPDDFSDSETLPPEYDQIFRRATSSSVGNQPRPPMLTGQLASSGALDSQFPRGKR
ncbi:hypothetical protein DFJ43DRAFT_1159833 [Lentinula guzmanii]|uniref:Uncharacterized protein n=1 Tax=Lentinula guzmanii TaxID=2804957 RepID=A0AA38MVP3_9AGAR|nr:hypothetical protein DFJ43DRAFT_1159833 [Lentinula guzmanii]